jgi:hypothetical protein
MSSLSSLYRWSGTYKMLDHYLKIRLYMNHGIWVDLLPVLQLIPSLAEDARLREIFNNLIKVHKDGDELECDLYVRLPATMLSLQLTNFSDYQLKASLH